MKIKDEFGKFRKDMLYPTYESLVYECKDYDKISRNKMIDEIVKEYKNPNYLYFICTKKELDFLKKFNNKKLNINDIEKYSWEINELNKKCIFSMIDYKVFDEQLENVKEALELHDKRSNKWEDDIAILIISMVKINANLSVNVLKSMVISLTKMSENDLENFLGNPLIHFYCRFEDIWHDELSAYEEMIIYRNYLDIFIDICEARKVYGMAGSIELNSDDIFDTFYYGFTVKKPSVKKMYDEINKNVAHELYFKIIDEARVLNNRNYLDVIFQDEELLEIINKALDDMPCAVMNGFTPKQYNKEIEKELILNKKFTAIPQNNAHLPKKAADEYYKLYFALLEYVNDKYKVSKKLKKIYQQLFLDESELYLIDDYLWEHKEIIDDFISENKYNFNEKELEQVKLFKTAVTSKNFVIIGFDREYTKFLSDDGKIYMVKGIRCDIDKIVDSEELPVIAGTTLLMFKDKIVYNGLLVRYGISFGNDLKVSIIEEMNKAITYYHL